MATTRKTSKRSRTALLAALAAISAFTPYAHAGTSYWMDADGLFWNNPSGWDQLKPPVSGDNAVIGTYNSLTISPLLNFTSNLSASPLNTLKIDSTALAGTMTLSQTLNSSMMVAIYEYIGYSIVCNVYTQNAGINSCPIISLGTLADGGGTYNLSGGSVTTQAFTVGDYGTGVLTQSGGIITVASSLQVGQHNQYGSLSTYTMTAGSLVLGTGANLAVGLSSGTFSHSAGTVSFGSGSGLTLNNGLITGHFGNYLLSGTGLLSNAAYESIGTAAATGGNIATFTQSGGINTLANGGTLRVGDTGDGAYNLSGGSLTTTNETIGNQATGLFHQTGGKHTVATSLSLGQTGASGFYTLDNAASSLSVTNEYVGYNGNGTFNQNAGTHFANNITLAGNPGSNGQYNLAGGTLTVGDGINPGSLRLGQNGNSAQFFQTGGNLNVPGTGANDGIMIGGSSPATFTMSGGNVSIGNCLWVGDLAPGTLTLTNGNITSRWLQVHGGDALAGYYAQSGGVASFGAAGGGMGNTATMNITGGTLSLGGTLTNLGSYTNSATLHGNASFNNQGTFIQGGTQVWAPGTTFTNTGGTATFNSDTGSPASSPLTFSIVGGLVTFNSNQHVDAINIHYAALSIKSGVTKTNALPFTQASGNWIGQVDITSAALVLQNADAAAKNAAIPNLVSQVNSGKNGGGGGAWTGTGITSSTLTTPAGANCSLAVVDNADLNLASFRNEPVDANSLILTVAHIGDANLDGKVDAFDLNLLASHWQQPANALWSAGDFTGDGKVDAFDLNALAANWQYPNNFPQAFTSVFPQFSQPAAVPEPMSLSLLVLALPLLARRRR